MSPLQKYFLGSVLVLLSVSILQAADSPSKSVPKSKSLESIYEPVVVGVPPVEAFNGLVQLPDGEIRHCGQEDYLFSRDHGLTWETRSHDKKDPSYQVSHYNKALGQNPKTGTWLRLWTSKEGTFTARVSGSPDSPFKKIKIDDEQFHMVRPPIFLKSRDRILFVTQTRKRPYRVAVFRSDDDGQTWEKTILPFGPHFEVKPPHGQPRWENRCCEATVAQLPDGRLWMIARSSQDRHQECFSTDDGQTWSAWRPSRFFGTLTMPTFFRLSDGRLIFFWCNTTPLPEIDRTNAPIHQTAKDGTWEDVFTNRDASHVAISEDNGKTWLGFREILLNPARNDADYADRANGDWSVHQSQALELPGGKVLLSLGQHPEVRRLLIFDPDWINETTRQNRFENGLDDWSVFQFFKEIRGHCAYNRTTGAKLVEHPDHPEKKVLRLTRRPDPRLVFDRDGAVWNFPSATRGRFTTRIRPVLGGKGGQICLLDRWINPTDPFVRDYAMFAVKFDAEGRLDTGDGNGFSKEPVLTPGAWQKIVFEWDELNQKAGRLSIDGKPYKKPIPLLNPSQNGLSYVHFQSTAKGTDPNGFLVESVQAESFAPHSKRASNASTQTADSAIEVSQFGATGDGQTDDTAALQKALDSGHHMIRVPEGTYLIRRTLRIGSNTTLSLDSKAVIRLGDGAAAEAGGDCFLICNRDLDQGNENITVEGGLWDGNCAKNPRGEEFAPDSYGGVGISFMKVDDLTISNLTVRNTEAFAIRVGEVNRFLIENILLDHTVIRPNQDGVHVGGFSENGVIRNISAKRPGVPNDDMIALNADDDVTRHFNRGMKLGPIRNLLVENISAADAYTFIRMLSNTAEIRDITIRKIRGGCRYNCLNLHRWRFPKGGGNIENVLIEDVEVAKRPGNNLPLIPVTLSVHNMRIRDFVRTDKNSDAKTLEIDDSIEVDLSIDIRRASK